MEVNNETQAPATKLEVVMGKKENGGLVFVSTVGHVLVWPTTSYYLVKLWMFGGQSYFLSASQNNPRKYTLFAKKQVGPDGSVKLQNPIGHGVVNEEMPEYIELRLKLLGRSVFVNLIPANGNFHEVTCDKEAA